MNSSAEFPARRRPVGGVGLEQRVLARFRRLRLPPKSTLVLGFSGGPDSVALGNVLARIASLGQFNLVAVHVDHRLRTGSDEEQVTASALASALGLRFRAELVSAVPTVLHPGVGVEEAARRERYLALARSARDEGAAIVVLAHHQQDQAETVLLHLARGAGLTGASGMAEVTTQAVPWWTAVPTDDAQELPIWRPLLSEPRSAVHAYSKGLGLTPIQDPSNVDIQYRRNAIRHNVLPVLERSIPGSTAALARFGQLAADDDAALTTIATGAAADAIDASGGLDHRALRPWPIAVQRRVLRAWVQDQTGYRGLTANRVEALLGFVQHAAPSSHIEIGDGLIVAMVGRAIRVGTLETLTQLARHEFPGPLFSACDGVKERSVALSPTVSLYGWRIDVSWVADGSNANHGHAHVATIADLGDDLVLRSPRRGDAWAVSGRKLGEWLKRRRVSSLIRADLVCVASRAGVRWVVGLPLPQFERKPHSDRLVHITVVKEQTEA